MVDIKHIGSRFLRRLVDASNEAIHKFGPPDIMNTDQGSQSSSFVWTDRLRRSSIRVSMDGKGRFLDNIFVERLWRSLKCECVFMHAWETGSEVKAGIRTWIEFYNHKRPHSSLGGRPPAMVYWQRNEATQPDQQVICYLRIADLHAWCSIGTLIKGAVNGRLFLSDKSLSLFQRKSGIRPSC